MGELFVSFTVEFKQQTELRVSLLLTNVHNFLLHNTSLKLYLYQCVGRYNFLIYREKKNITNDKHSWPDCWYVGSQLQ